MNFRRKQKSSVDIGLIPMIDVLLVLLFFFMLATTFRQHTDLRVNLPQATVQDQQALGKSINLFIDAQGVYSLEDSQGKILPLAKQDSDSLKSALSAWSENVNSLPFIISADGKTPHQAVITAMDIARQLGFYHITFAITPQVMP